MEFVSGGGCIDGWMNWKRRMRMKGETWVGKLGGQVDKSGRVAVVVESRG